jgi:hypothetical protein
MLAAEDLDIADWRPYVPEDHHHALQLNSMIGRTVAGACREIILADFVKLSFYAEALDWFESGHWRCAIASDGRRVVF